MKKKKELPSVSFLTITLNPDLKVFKKSLDSIALQSYPKGKIEHIVVDGGSKAPTLNLAKAYKCKIVVRKDLRNSSEARMGLAIKKAKNDIVLWFAADNILPSKISLEKLVEPFLHDSNIISSYTLHYHYSKNSSLLDRYCALLGVSDPVVLYLGKADRETWLSNKFNRGKVVKRKKNFDIVEFNRDNLPTVGANGFLTKRKILLKANVSEEKFVHIDVFVDLMSKGFNRFGIVNSTAIEHVIGRNILDLVRRRVIYAKRYSLEFAEKRRYFVFDINSKRDMIRILKFIFFTFTIIQPLILSIKGFIKIRDFTWFLHPLMCWLFLLYYVRYTVPPLLRMKISHKI